MTAAWISEYWESSQNGAVPNRHLRHWICVLGLAIADGLSFVLSFAIFRLGHRVPSVVLFIGGDPNHPSTPVDIFAVLAAIFVVVRYLSGDYGRRQLFWDGAKLTTMALFITSLPDIIMAAIGNAIYSPVPVIVSWLFLLPSVPLLRQVARIVLLRMGIWPIPTAMIGIGPRAAKVHSALKHSLSLGFAVRWLVIENPDAEVPIGLEGLHRAYSSDAARIAQLMLKAGCKQALVASEDIQSTHFADVCQRLLEVNIPVAVIPSLSRLPMAGMTTNYFFGRDILLLQMRSNVQRLPWRIVKRSFDIVTSLLLLALLSPLFLILAIAIKGAHSGSVTYGHQRIGRYGRPFKCLKFRSMVADADERLRRWSVENPILYEEYLKTFKLKDDPRITPIGGWLRKTSLDELPQLLNVLRGEMSLVGPRPVVAQELDDYYGPAAQVYKRARPGITGLWQVSGRSETSYEQRVILDEWYILNWSFWYDIVILIQTAWIVVSRKGAF